MSNKVYKILFDYHINIYAGALVGALAIFYYNGFHFATIAFSYFLGCVACYYGLKSRILLKYVDQLGSYVAENPPKQDSENHHVNGCETCGSAGCSRHDTSITAEPWTGLQIHKQLDQAIEDFYNTILEQFINIWYSKITLQPFFIDELRHQLRYASASLLRRAVKINYSQFITERLLPCALRHYTVCAGDGALPLVERLAIHPAAANRNAELKYLRAITNAIMPYLLRSNELNSSIFQVLIREIFSGWVLLPLTDVLADPHVLNTLVILATGDETMAQLPATPNYKVEFLETFVRQTESVYSARCQLLRVDLDLVVNEQSHFYALMQYMKATPHIHLLQFYKDIKSFQSKILNPDLSPEEIDYLYCEACSIYRQYLSSGTDKALEPLAVELRGLLAESKEAVCRLQTSRALYQAARQSHTELEKNILPKFLHSEEFYKLFIGSRVPTGYHKQMFKKPQEKLLQTALKLGTKLKGALRSQAVDGHVLDCFTNSELSDADSVDNMDILKYLDSIAAEDNLREQDLSTYKVVLTDVETRLQVPPRRGRVRVFTLTVHRADGAGGALWTTERSEHDFHLLRAKLHEFHGDQLLSRLPLPSRRDNSPLETLRYKYEDFLQQLLQKSLLQTSELLHLFLTVDGDFSLVVQASSLNPSSTDLANIYQTVTHRLRKEKGQHLESFLKNLLVSSDMERYQALKQGTHVEEAQEVSEEIEDQQQKPVERVKCARDFSSGVFGDNFGVECSVSRVTFVGQTVMAGFTQCLMYILIKIVNARCVVCGVAGTVLTVARKVADSTFNSLLNRALCDLLTEPRLAHLIRLGQGLLFDKKPSAPHKDPAAERDQALTQLLSVVPYKATLLLGSGLPVAITTAFHMLQSPQLNKQLLYNLLDLCLLELFPELSATEISTVEPKS